MENKDEGRPPVSDALLQRHRAAGRKGPTRMEDREVAEWANRRKRRDAKSKGLMRFRCAMPA